MKHLVSALRIYLFFTLFLGLLYPLAVTALGQLAFPHHANGSLVEIDGKVVGSELIAQKFESERYFWPRPSATDYNPLPSGGSNLGPTSQALLEASKARRDKLGENAPGSLLFASASGLDPHIEPSAAYHQVSRIAFARKVSPEKVRDIIDANVESRDLRVFGEERVNVLRLNLALDRLN